MNRHLPQTWSFHHIQLLPTKFISVKLFVEGLSRQRQLFTDGTKSYVTCVTERTQDPVQGHDLVQVQKTLRGLCIVIVFVRSQNQIWIQLP